MPRIGDPLPVRRHGEVLHAEVDADRVPNELPAGVEFVLILAGQLRVTVAGEEVTLEEGDALTFTADMAHTFQAPPQAGRARLLWVLSPALPDHGIELPPPAG